MGFSMVGITPDPAMIIGLALIGIGLAASVYGLVPGPDHAGGSARSVPRVRAIDDAPLTLRHVCVLLVLAAAVTIDVVKPTTLAFVQPGSRRCRRWRLPRLPVPCRLRRRSWSS
jgi:putative MFS transporter